MKTEMPLSKPIRRFLKQTEEMLDTEITLLRKPDAEPGGTLVDVFTYDMEKNVNVIIFPAQYIGLLKDFIIAKHCTHLLIKGAAFKKSKYKVCSFTEDSVYRGMRQIYIDALKDEYPGVRLAAAKALGEIGDESAVDPLIQALKDDNKGVRTAALEALVAIEARSL